MIQFSWLNWTRRIRRGVRREEPCVAFESLEPRILLSSEAPGAALDAAAIAAEFQSSAVQLDPNLQVVDLTDLDGDLPLDVVNTTQILWQTEDWEHPTWKNPSWPAGGGDTVGFPAVVKNDKGPNPDGKYYMFYAHHDPRSGIGVAVADSITGPYSKNVNVPGRSDNLVVPAFHQDSTNIDDPDHTSSPWVVWSEQEQLWFVYFHYFNHIRNVVPGFQLTAMATTPDLASHNWTIWMDPSGGTTPGYRPVLPTTSDHWISEASSYNTVHRLPDGRWLAFLRGKSTTAGDPPELGFATSTDGRNWNYFAENPIIHQGDGGGGRPGVYRPSFIGYLGKNAGGQDEYLLAWQESHFFDGGNQVIFGRTTDFKSVTRDPRGYATWPAHDGAISAFREGDRLYLFSGKFVHEMVIPVVPDPDPDPATLSYFEDFGGATHSFDDTLGTWQVSGSDRYETAAGAGHSVSLLNLSGSLPGDVRFGGTLRGLNSGASRNAMLIFDYHGPNDFKYAGAFFGTGDYRIGRYDGSAFLVDQQVGAAIGVNQDYQVELRLDGTAVYMSVGGQTLLIHDYGASLTDGAVGLGGNQAAAAFDDVLLVGVTVLPFSDDFADGAAPFIEPVSGTWSVNSSDRLQVDPAGGNAISLVSLSGAVPGVFEMSGVTRGRIGGPGTNRNTMFILDYLGPDDFNFVGAYLGS
ncbi:MAG: hypothetical protein CMJ18_14270, partial [Phycisphaeraceae bacterium]|nr:hypothetical protein [Phycisphaeraceae bacterium]